MEMKLRYRMLPNTGEIWMFSEGPARIVLECFPQQSRSIYFYKIYIDDGKNRGPHPTNYRDFRNAYNIKDPPPGKRATLWKKIRNKILGIRWRLLGV